ncbi:thioredoxin [Rhodohalobacter sp. SW132]|uniref:thioredoxin n=1 Tax=Rhodohalobacter sp. SW132 TaxID=2293433 RepID=UPI000E228B8F|nr:thioredoxin [Rhodohalobacter sp. SW132]REL24595.1 thioredoxin [Rhodohalobacter sp. SW132]
MNTKPTSFTELINGDTPVLVDFYADWCGPCKMMGPILKDLKKKAGDTVNIIKIDAEKNADAAIRYNVRGVPTLILFHRGKVLWQQSGVVQADQLHSIIKQKTEEL